MNRASILYEYLALAGVLNNLPIPRLSLAQNRHFVNSNCYFLGGAGEGVIGHREVTSAVCSSSRTPGVVYSQVRVVTFLFPAHIGLAV